MGLSLVDLTLATGVPEQIDSSETRLYEPATDEVTEPPGEGRPGRVAILEPDFGGCGNEAILTVFRTVRSGTGPAIAILLVFNVGTAGVEYACWDFDAALGIVARDGVRIASFEGVWGTGEVRPETCGAPRLLRFFEIGRGGNAALGGAQGGSEGRGSDFVVDIMVKVIKANANANARCGRFCDQNSRL